MGGIRVEMALRREAMEKLALLPDTAIRAILGIMDELLRKDQHNILQNQASTMEKKKAAFHALKKMREQYPFPDIDFDEARRDAMEAKYGRIA